MHANLNSILKRPTIRSISSTPICVMSPPIINQPIFPALFRGNNALSPEISDLLLVIRDFQAPTVHGDEI
jgi:hypothetical protein